jgi:hypothetical protein
VLSNRPPPEAGTPNPPRWESRLQAVGRPDCQRVRFFPSALDWGEALPAEAGTPNLRRAESYARRYGWFLKMDVRFSGSARPSSSGALDDALADPAAILSPECGVPGQSAVEQGPV